MVVPTFDPGTGGSSGFLDNFTAGAGQVNSWMDRAQSRQISAQDAEIRRREEIRAQAQHELELPVKEAEVKAKTVTLAGQVAAGVQMNDLIANAGQEMPDIRASWLSTFSVNEPKQRLLMQDKVLGMADKYSSLKGFGEEIKQWHEAYAQGAMSDRARDMLMNRSEIANIKSDSAAQVAQLRTESSSQIQTLREQHQKEMADINAKNSVETTSQKLQNEGAYKVNEATIAAGKESMKNMGDVNRGIGILEEGIRTGSFAGKETQLERLGTLFGIEAKDLKDREQLQEVLGSAVLKRVNQTKGSISDKEMSLFDSYSASINKSPAGNLAIMRAYAKSLQRDVDIAKQIQSLRAAGKPEREIQSTINNFVLENPLFSPKEESAVTGESAVHGPDWSDEKEQRIQELRKKLGK